MRIALEVEREPLFHKIALRYDDDDDDVKNDILFLSVPRYFDLSRGGLVTSLR